MDDSHRTEPPPPLPEKKVVERPWSAKLKSASLTVIHHARKHVGVGTVCAVAYFDPGNWGVDLQAGSQFGYRLLFIVLLAGLFAVFLQVLATRLGCVTGVDLATHSRLLLYNRPTYPRLQRWLFLYPLYVLAEIAIVSTDLAELLGSAIALCLLFPSLPLWAGVLITAFDVLLILALGDPLRSRPVRMFELLIIFLVLGVMVCMLVIITKLNINWADTFLGFVPSKYIFKSGGLYTSIGILGATVMPHSLFLGSALATQDRLSNGPTKALDSAYSLDTTAPVPLYRRLAASAVQTFKEGFKVSPAYRARPTRYSDRENNSLEFIGSHLTHGVVDIAGSLLGFAVLINSMILILASATFFYGPGSSGEATPASLFDAHTLIKERIGKGAALLFALALLCSGQSSSLIATVAGQAVCEGFLNWRLSPIFRRLLTRMLSMIPAMAVAIAVGKPGINTLLVASQVVLSIVLPFVTFPLIWCTSSKSIMRVAKTPADTVTPTTGDQEAAVEYVDYSSGKIVTGLGVAIWLLIVAANMYVIVELAIGASG